METWLAVVVGGFYAAAFYLLMRRSIVKLILGLALLGHAANLLIFTVGRVTRETPPIVPRGAEVLERPFADPVPQALILTAIVIGFGVQAFALVLLRKAYQATGSEDIDAMSRSDDVDFEEDPA